MSNYVKTVLIEKGKLDRFQQRQIWEVSYDNMGDIKTRIAMILDDKQMLANAKDSLLKFIKI